MEFYIIIRNANKLAVQKFEKMHFQIRRNSWSIELSISLLDQYDRRLDNKFATRNSNVRKSCILVQKRIWGKNFSVSVKEFFHRRRKMPYCFQNNK